MKFSENSHSNMEGEKAKMAEMPDANREVIRLKLAKKLKYFLDEEQKFGRMPKVEFDFYFSSHVLAEDLNNVDEFFKQADIVFPEVHGWEPNELDVYNLIAQGKLDPNKFISRIDSGKYISALLKKIYNSKKIIGLADVPLGHHSAELERHDGCVVRGKKLIQAANAGASLEEQVRIGSAEIGKMQSEREEYILLNLGKRLKEIFNTYPDLAKKSEVRVLFTLGASHTTLYQALAKAGINTKRKFSRNPYVYGNMGEGLRQVMMTKEHKLDEENIPKIALFQAFWEKSSVLNWKRWQTDFGQIIMRVLINQLTTEEAISIIHSKTTFEDFVKKLREKNITLPTTDTEADILIDKYYPK